MVSNDLKKIICDIGRKWAVGINWSFQVICLGRLHQFCEWQKRNAATAALPAKHDHTSATSRLVHMESQGTMDNWTCSRAGRNSHPTALSCCSTCNSMAKGCVASEPPGEVVWENTLPSCQCNLQLAQASLQLALMLLWRKISTGRATNWRYTIRMQRPHKL